MYNIAVPNSARRLPTASQMLAAFAKARGWTTGAGLPDEARAGRQVGGAVRTQPDRAAPAGRLLCWVTD